MEQKVYQRPSLSALSCATSRSCANCSSLRFHLSFVNTCRISRLGMGFNSCLQWLSDFTGVSMKSGGGVNEFH